MRDEFVLTVSRELAEKLIRAVEDHDLYTQIVEQQTGEPLDDCLITHWTGHWPVIDADCRLTGEVVDSEVRNWSNYRDEAAIFDDVAEKAGWTISGDYASPGSNDA